MTKMASAPAPQFQQRDLFEYKIYSLQRRTDVANNESKQIELVSAVNAAAHKLSSMTAWIKVGAIGSTAPTIGASRIWGAGKSKVGVYVTFRNDEKSGLGMPLPKGKVRVYKKDEDGREQFVGETRWTTLPRTRRSACTWATLSTWWASARKRTSAACPRAT